MYTVTIEVHEATQGYFSVFDVIAFSKAEAENLVLTRIGKSNLNLHRIEIEQCTTGYRQNKPEIIREYGKSYFELN